jgi:D-alanine--poly(phosphoribitol) ligase subunit 2
VTATLEKVMDVLVTVVESSEIRAYPDIRLYDQHLLDSLGTVHLLLGLSESFGIELSPAEVEREEWATPRLIAEYLERRSIA